MTTSTTFRTTTGTLWTVTGTVLTRLCSERAEPRDAYAAVPNAVDRAGTPYVAVRVDGMVTFLADGTVKTTGRIAEVVRVASVVSAA
jgi:hypothetical protein